MTIPRILSTDPARGYNVTVAGQKKSDPLTQPLRNLVANLRWLHLRPWLAESSLETVVEAWQHVQREQRAEVTP